MVKPKKKRSKRASVMIRYSFLLGIILLVASWISYNTFRNAVLDASHWNALASKELSRMTTVIQPDRGDILAADGSVLSTTLQYYTLRIDYGSEGFDWKGYVAEKDMLADSLAHYFPIRGGVKAWQDSLDVVLKRGTRPRGWRLINNITYADYLQIKEFPFFKGRKPGKSGLAQPEVLKRRRMPYGDMARLSIGVVAEDTTGESHGMSGLEKALDDLLYGKPGLTKQVNFTRGIGKWVEVPAVRGWDVTSTIDVQMQDILENCLLNRLELTKAEWGSAVLMEVATGEIKAICNFEENPKKKGEGEYIEAMNRAVQGYEPGSVVKTISLMIAIEDGYVTNLDSVVQIGARYNAFGLSPAITDSHFNESLTVKGIIEQSSNIGMAKVMSRYYRNPQGWHDRLASIGFLEKLNSGIGEEVEAKFPVAQNGPLVTLSRQFYGYGCEIPPLHTLSIYNAIANGGKYVRPRLVKSLHREGVDSVVGVSYIRPQVCSERTASMMQECLYEVVNGSRGTARSLKNPYVTLAGKTGTAYSVQPGKGYNKAHKRLAFCGYFPAEKPKYSCVVLIYHPREMYLGAASTSGVVLRDVAMSLFARGMLDNESDYREGADPTKVEAPELFASADGELQNAVRRTIGTAPKATPGGRKKAGVLPDVMHMGLREAVSTLENAGADVTFEGVGLVQAQNPAAGQPLASGQKVHLILKP